MELGSGKLFIIFTQNDFCPLMIAKLYFKAYHLKVIDMVSFFKDYKFNILKT